MAQAEGTRQKKSKGHPMELRIRRTLDGGHIVAHHQESADGGYMEPKIHKFPAGHGEEAAAHILKHAGLKPVKGEGSMHENSRDIEDE